MQFEEAGEPPLPDRLAAAIADRIERLFEGDPVAIGDGVGLVAGEGPGEDARSQHRRRKPAAFLIGPVDQLDRRLGTVFHVVQGAQHFEPGQHAQHAVEFAAGRLGVEMRAHRDRQRLRVLALAPSEHRPDIVDRDRAAQRFALRAEPVPHLPVLLAQRQPPDPAPGRAADFGCVHQRVPEALRIDLQIG